MSSHYRSDTELAPLLRGAYAVILSLLSAVLAVAPAQASTGNEYCGGRSISMYTTLGSVRVRNGKPQIRSAEAIAAIVGDDETLPVAWIAWDEQGVPWIVFTDRPPDRLLQMLSRYGSLQNLRKRLALGIRIIALPGATVNLPTGYKLASCNIWIDAARRKS